MNNRNLIEFLRMPAAQVDLLKYLKVKRKDKTIITVAEFEYPFGHTLAYGD